MAGGLRSLDNVTVEVEPRLPPNSVPNDRGERRDDIRVIGSPESGLAVTDYDVHIPTLGRATLFPSHLELDSPDSSHDRIKEALKMAANRKTTSLNLAPDAGLTMTPLVFSTGGEMEDVTEGLLKSWKARMRPGAYGFMMSRISVSPARSRGQAYRTA